MTRRLIVLAVALAAFTSYTSCYAATRPYRGLRAGRAPAAGPQAGRAPAAGQEKVVLSVKLPPAGRAPAGPMVGGPGAGHGPRCPQTQINGILGVTITQPHGCVLGQVSAHGPAGKAGLKAGDSIVEADGQVVTCPSALLPFVQPGAKGKTVKLGVMRAKAAGAKAKAAAPSKPAPAKAAAAGKPGPAKPASKPAPASKSGENQKSAQAKSK